MFPKHTFPFVVLNPEKPIIFIMAISSSDLPSISVRSITGMGVSGVCFFFFVFSFVLDRDLDPDLDLEWSLRSLDLDRSLRFSLESSRSLRLLLSLPPPRSLDLDLDLDLDRDLDLRRLGLLDLLLGISLLKSQAMPAKDGRRQ